jgi:hypothetical protein
MPFRRLGGGMATTSSRLSSRRALEIPIQGTVTQPWYVFEYNREAVMRGLVVVFALVLLGVPLWRIVKRTGLPPVLSLLAFVPVANVIFVWVFAFMEWPALKQPPTS